MDFNDNELDALSFAYTHVYDAYLKIKRMRSITLEEKQLRLKHYKEKLLKLQKIMKFRLKIDVVFKEIPEPPEDK